MSISDAVQPTTAIKRRACCNVRVLVAKPGIVTARMFERGRPSVSMAWAQTSSAWVESSPPEMPMTTLAILLADRRCTKACTWML
ncbi:hypothetical protein G6F68_021022 [Rhizopus microsporus]|nr:hypothetical protein G6F68_021022 [Rhizopus microsporus]